MNLVKVRKSQQPTFSNIMDEFFNREPFHAVGNRPNMSNRPAANVRENEKEFRLELATPGLKKEDIKVEVKDDHLIISSETKTEHKEEDGRFTRKEFSYSAFKRRFALPDNVNEETIAANYKDGVLSLSIPKATEEKADLSRTIEVK